MAMTARLFLEQLNRVKASIQEGERDDELQASFDRVMSQFKKSYTPESFKGLLEANEAVDTELEEDMTTCFMLWMRRRGST